MMDTNELVSKAKERMAEVRAEIDAIKAASASHRQARDALLIEEALVKERIEAATKQINAIEQPRLHELKMELGKLARMTGGY